MKYDAQKEMTGLIHLVNIPPVISTNAGSGVQSIGDLVKRAKARPGEVTYGTAGPGTNNHLTMELVSQATGIAMQHIPLKGDAPVMIEVLADRIVAASNTLPGVLPHLRSGKLRALAVGSRERSPLLPEVPTLVEQGVDAVTNTWFGLVMNAGTPADIVTRLNAEFNAALAAPDVRERLIQVGMTPVGGTPAQFNALIRSERERWGAIIKARGIKAE
jgi:tripartite-type tricarboxylate transporter receptor subunit TctC